jgi:phosphoadenosine phosphosulfate reductase
MIDICFFFAARYWHSRNCILFADRWVCWAKVDLMSEVAYFDAAEAAHLSNRAERDVIAPPGADSEISSAFVDSLADELTPLDLFQRMATIRSRIRGRVVFTTSFGLEDQAIAHAIFSQTLPIAVATLDTGRLFPETHDVWTETERRYGIRVLAFAPTHTSVAALIARQGLDGLYDSVAARLDCCAIRKVAPLARALDGSAAWITGIRADQSADRARFSPASFDAQRRLIKVNPLFDWTREQTFDFVRAHQVPYNTLHDRGFLSIGCAPCTRAVAPGESERAGRWWWEQSENKECGLRVAGDGRVMRASPPQI